MITLSAHSDYIPVKKYVQYSTGVMNSILDGCKSMQVSALLANYVLSERPMRDENLFQVHAAEGVGDVDPVLPLYFLSLDGEENVGRVHRPT